MAEQNATVVTFTVPGNPVPQPRARVSTRGGFARAYVPGKHPVHEYRRAVAEAAKAAGLRSTGKPLAVAICAVFARPASHRTRTGLRKGAPLLPRPDVDNLGKSCLDALQPVFGNDTLVSTLAVTKCYGDEARTTIFVTEDTP